MVSLVVTMRPYLADPGETMKMQFVRKTLWPSTPLGVPVYLGGSARACCDRCRQLDACALWTSGWQPTSKDRRVPTGTSESSPRFQPWVASGKYQSPEGAKEKLGLDRRFFRPSRDSFGIRATNQRWIAGLFSRVPAGRGIAKRY